MTQAFERVLMAQRDGLNARYAHAARLNRRLDSAGFSAHLLRCVAPVVEAVAAHGAEDAQLQRIATTLFDLSLDLVGRDLAGPGARHPWISRLWVELLPLLPELLVRDCRDVVAALSNAIHNLACEPGIRPDAWLAAMTEQAGAARDRRELLDLGQVLAWRWGMAHFRDSALATWSGLPEVLRRSSLNLDAEADLAAVAHALSQRWSALVASSPANRIEMVAQVGGFRGFGGAFLRPPRVRQAEGLLYAFDDQQCFTVHADRFGATLKRHNGPVPAAGSSQGGLAIDRSGAVRGPAGLTATFSRGTLTSAASTDDTLAVTLDHSHHVFLLAAVA